MYAGLGAPKHMDGLLVTLCHVPTTAMIQGLALASIPKCPQPGQILD